MVSRNNRLRSMRNRVLTIDLSELIDFQERTQDLAEVDLDNYLRDLTKELGSRLMSKAVKRTPVDTGLLRRNWTMSNVEDHGDYYEIRVINPTEYAAYVELGHRTRDRQKWVNGYFMLYKSTLEIESEIPQVIERELTRFLKEKLGI